MFPTTASLQLEPVKVYWVLQPRELIEHSVVVRIDDPFLLGLGGLMLNRRNVIIVLIFIELMLLAVN